MHTLDPEFAAEGENEVEITNLDALTGTGKAQGDLRVGGRRAHSEHVPG